MRKILILSITALILVSCATKRSYFEPEVIAGEIKFDGKISDDIINTSAFGATLENGEVLDIDGIIQDLKLEKSEKFLGKFDDIIAISKTNGDLEIKQSNQNIFSHNFQAEIISVNIDNSDLAALSSDNKIYLINLETGDILLKHDCGDSFAQDSRTAAPVFLGSLVIFPSLDGKIFMADRASGNLIRSITISDEPFFNNVIFLDVYQDKLFAATNTKILMFSPAQTKYFDEDIKQIILYASRIYALLKNGQILILDDDLNQISKQEFEYAIFSNIIPKGEKLYIFEKTGYMIKTDLDLQNPEIYEMSGEIDEKSFAGKKAFYQGNLVINLK